MILVVLLLCSILQVWVMGTKSSHFVHRYRIGCWETYISVSVVWLTEGRSVTDRSSCDLC
uniref:Uncharacterized protein n=2 Tax=Amphimedon queenslandica TaxID=400682 RepID=A0A1X7TSU8_AMPQE